MAPGRLGPALSLAWISSSTVLVSTELLCTASPRDVDWRTSSVCTLPRFPGGLAAAGGASCEWRVSSLGGEAARWRVGATLLGHSNSVCALAFDASGQLLVSGSADGTAQVWSRGPRQPEDRAGARESGGGKITSERVRSASNGAFLHQAADWQADFVLRSSTPSLVRDVRFAPGGNSVLSAHADGTARIWQRRDPSADASSRVPSPPSPPASEDYTFVGCFDVSQFRARRYYGNAAAVRFAAMAEQATKDDLPYFAMSRHDHPFGHAYTFLRPVGTPLYGTAACGSRCDDHSTRWCGCANEDMIGRPNSDCPSGIRSFAVYRVLETHMAEQVDPSTFAAAPPPWALSSQLVGHNDTTWTAYWQQNGVVSVAVGAADRTACIPRQPAAAQVSPSLVSCLSADTDVIWRERGLAAPSSELFRVGRIWQSEVGESAPPWTLAAYMEEQRPRLVTAAQWSFDGTRLLTGGNDGVASIWQLGGRDVDGSSRKRWDVVTSFKAHAQAVWTIAWAPDSARVLTGSKDGILRIWRPRAKKPSEWEIAVTLDELSGSAPSDIVGSASAQVEDARSKGYPWSFSARLNQRSNMDWLSRPSRATVAAWSPDGLSIAIGSRDGVVRIWQESAPDPLQWQVVATLHGHEGIVWSLAWSPDSSQLASGGADAKVRIWSLVGGAPAAKRSVGRIRNSTECEFVRYQGFSCPSAGGSRYDMLEDFEGTLDQCLDQCCMLGETCAGFEVVGGSAAAAENEDVDRQAVGSCRFRGGQLKQVRIADVTKTGGRPPQDCYKHVRASASEHQDIHRHPYPHGHHHPF